ncbi:SgcJ/EcaC family oxidoreductase [Micromonospora halotolerans]|uniref:SgcJ/EcaC family oxidoreductase n=1 Tax=Micromonospora halotolerans TaxID=709879 RepID=A0ABY9ZSK9_9ACTN|nr:SgcJ/EcaC family oxidoreductase [Micromonospora halotolerans]WNM38005.1 SgcJ/EcaC family oxidoreductase [Micromonospora halotolerans]
MTTTAHAGVLDALTGLEACWQAGDAGAYATLHAPDATYVAFDGTVMTGREEIVEGHRRLFDGIMRGSRLAVVERTIRFLDPATAIVVQRAGIIMRWQRGRTVPSRKRLSTNTTVLRRDGDRWLVVAFHNTRYHPWAETLVGRLMTRSAT